MSFNIRFHHGGTYWHRLEVRKDGFHFKYGDLASSTYSDIHAARVAASQLAIGSVTIGEAELAVLKRLAAGELNVELFSSRLHEYAYAADSTTGQNHYVFSRSQLSAEHRRWVLKPLASD